MQKCWVICSWWGSAFSCSRVEVDGVLDQAVDPQPVVDEVAVEQRLVLVGVGVLAVVPEIGRDVLLAVLARFGVDVLEQVLQRSDDRLAGALYDPRVADGERCGGYPSDQHDHHRGGEEPEPHPAVVGSPGVDMVEVDQQPRGEHERHVHHDEDQEPDEHEEVQRACGLDAEYPADPPEARGQRGGHPEAGDQRERGGDEDGDEVGDQLQTVVGGPATFGRPVQREVLDQHRQRVREHVPAGGNEALPSGGREQQGDEDHAVEQPERVDAEVPPAREADRVAKPRQTDLARKADRVLLGRPERVGRHRLLDPKPVLAGRGVARPIQPGVVGENLDARADDEDHEEQVEEVLPPRPGREACRRLGP